MAPEQFVTGQSSAQSDVWALGVLIYELASGQHPFARPDAEDFQAIRAIQFHEPADLSAVVPAIAPELKSVIAACLEKNPAARYASAAEVREALKTVMKALQIETGILPADAALNLPATGPEAEKRATGFLSMLAERFRESAAERSPNNSIVVLPFANLGADNCCAVVRVRAGRRHRRAAGADSCPGGAALKHADAAIAQPIAHMDPLAVGQKLMVSLVLAGICSL